MNKKLLVAFSVLAFSLISAVDLCAQGTINFANSSTTLVVTNDPLGGFGKATKGTYQVALYWAPLGSTEADLVQIGPAKVGNPVDGRFSSSTPYTTPSATAPGQDALFQVRGWTGNYSTFEDALLSGDPNVLLGISDMWQNPTGGAGLPPSLPANIYGPGRFEGLLLETP